MVSRAPTWELFYKNLDKNLEINLKMDKIMEFNLSTVPESDWISNFCKESRLITYARQWFREASFTS